MRLLPLFIAGVVHAQTFHTQLSVPPLVQTGGHQNDFLVFAGYLDATLYGADPNGAADSTQAIQKAINDARDYGLVTYLPPGTYKVSSTLTGLQELGNPSCNRSTVVAYGTQYHDDNPAAPSLVGPGSGPRPRLVLMDGSAGFGDPNHPQPILHVLNDGVLPNGQPGPECLLYGCNSRSGQSDCLFNAVVRDIDISVGANPGAVGLQFYSAQYSYVENVSVDATGGYAGIEGAATTSTMVNVSVTGGQYGMLIDDIITGSVVGLTLRNQSVAGVMDYGAVITIAGFDIVEAAAPAFRIDQPNGPQTGSYSLFDGHVSAAGGLPAIVNTNSANLHLSNVYAQAGTVLIQNSGQTALAASGGVDRIDEYAFTDTGAGPNGVPKTSFNVVNGTEGQQQLAPKVTPNVGAYPGDLLLRHLPGQLPWISDPGAALATAYGADPTAATDSTAALQSAIDASDEVFLPRGDYAISGTLQLHPNTRLFGVPGMRSRLIAPYWNPNGQYQPYLRTADSADGATYVGDLYLDLDSTPNSNIYNTTYAQTYLNGIDWQTGRSSVQNEVAVGLGYSPGPDFTSAARKLVHVLNHGGGRWYGLQEVQIAGGCREDNADYRMLLVDGTQAPLTLYGPNPEHAGPFLFELSGASNFRILGEKTESNGMFTASASSNFLISGLSGDYGPGSLGALSLSGCSNVELDNLTWYSGPYSGVLLTVDGTTYSFADALSQVQIGSFDPSVFPSCGDGVCDGAESSANCPHDCGDAGSGSDAGAQTDAGSGGADAGPAWGACLADGGPSWGQVPRFLIPHTRALPREGQALPASDSVLSAQVQTAWDRDNLYVRVEVTDPEAVNNPALPPFQSNAVELYLDRLDSRSSSYGPGDVQFVASADDRLFANPAAAPAPVHQVTALDGGYAVTFAVPWSSPGAIPPAIGFDVAVDQNADGGTLRTAQLMWSGDGSAYMDPRQFGQLVLSPFPCLPISPPGADAGSPSGSGADAGAPLGRPGSEATGCGCGSAPPVGFLLAFLLPWLRVRRSPRRSGRGR